MGHKRLDPPPPPPLPPPPPPPSPVSTIYTVESVHLRFAIFTHNFLTHCFCQTSRYSFHLNVYAILKLPNLSNYVPFDSVKHLFPPYLADQTWSFRKHVFAHNCTEIYNGPIELHFIRTGQPIVYRPHGWVQWCLEKLCRCTRSTVYIILTGGGGGGRMQALV